MGVHIFTDSQVDKVRHALGLTRSNIAYRNYYNCDGDADWDDLVERGFAVKQTSSFVPGVIYRITKRASFFFLDAGDKIGPNVDFPESERPTTPTDGGER